LETVGKRGEEASAQKAKK